MRCSKTIPCHRCIEQDREDLCVREPVQLRTRRAQFEQAVEARVLRDLLLKLSQAAPQTVMRHVNDRLVQIEATADPDDTKLKMAHITRKIKVTRENSPADEISPESHDSPGAASELALRLEYLAWGHNQDERNLENISGGSSRPIRFSGASLKEYPWDDLPSRQTAQTLIEFYIKVICWEHEAIHCPTFLDQCERFWKTSHVEHPCWMALYYSILAVRFESPFMYPQYRLTHRQVAAWCYPRNSNKDLDIETDLHILVEKWYLLTLKMLNESNFIGNHSSKCCVWCKRKR